MKPWRLSASRVVTVLAALGSYGTSAATGHPWVSIPVLVMYGVTLAGVFKKRPSPGAHGAQLGVAAAGIAFFLRVLPDFLGFWAFGAVVSGHYGAEIIATRAALPATALFNSLMLWTALNVPLYLAWDRRARVKFLLSVFFMFIVASGCWYLLLKAIE